MAAENNSPVSIRRAAAADAPALGRLGAALARQHHTYDPRRFVLFEPVEEGFARFYAEQAARADTAVLVAESGGRAVGFVFARLEPASYLDALPPSGWVHDLYVEEAARGAGVGRRLLDAAIEALARLGALGVMLAVAPQNPAGQWYERRGFRVTHREMRLDLTPEDARGPGPGS
jgi:GNAT superfamily N-acetyltransferase